MKKIMIVFLILISCLSHAQTINNGHITKNINGLNIIIDKRIEMLSVIQYLANSKMIYIQEISYADSVKKYFDSFKNHKAVTLYKEMEKHGFSYHIPMYAMLFLDSGFKQIKSFDKETIQRASGKKKLNKFVKQLQDFNIKTNFDKFFKDNNSLYNKSMEILIDSSFKDFNEIKYIEDFYGYKQHTYNIILRALSYHSYGVTLEAGKGVYDIYDIQGVQGNPINKLPFFGNEQTFKYIVWHEFGHSFVNPLVTEHYKELDKYNKLKDPIIDLMKKMAYGYWENILNEHIIRAITASIANVKYGKEEALRELENDRNNGFIYIDSLYSKILYYSKNKSTKNFKQFFPELISVIKYYADNPVEFKHFPPPNDLFSEGKFILIYSTNETSDSLNILLKKYVEYVNDKLFKLSEERIIADTVALKRNLKDFNVCCYGSINGNLWLKSKIHDLPIKIFKDKIIVSTTTYNQSNLRVICTWQNPDNPDRFALIFTSQNSEQILKANRVFHGPENWVIANDNFEVIAKGNYSYSNGKFFIK